MKGAPSDQIQLRLLLQYRSFLLSAPFDGAQLFPSVSILESLVGISKVPCCRTFPRLCSQATKSPRGVVLLSPSRRRGGERFGGNRQSARLHSPVAGTGKCTCREDAAGGRSGAGASQPGGNQQTPSFGTSGGTR